MSPLIPLVKWNIRFAPRDETGMEQFYFTHDGRERVVRLHDYREIYQVPGLYEYVVQDLLQCRSPAVAVDVLDSVLRASGREPSGLRVLDLGAGNGIVGELLKVLGVGLLVGVDNILEAKEACLRDRPGVYDGYYVEDLAHFSPNNLGSLQAMRLNCLIAIGALGGGHIGADGLSRAMEIMQPKSLLVLTVRSDMLEIGSHEPFGRLVDEATKSGALTILHQEEFLHRITTEGDPIKYVVLAAAIGDGLISRSESTRTEPRQTARQIT